MSTLLKKIGSGLVALSFFVGTAEAGSDFDDKIEPLLATYCFDCHSDGILKGDFAMDEWESIDEHANDHVHWLKVWRNLRGSVMPPAEKKQPTAAEKALISSWIESKVFKLDPKNPDPGRVTIRRLNRTEYENTIQDLYDVNFDVDEEFPPDDTGYGFDTIGDVLSLSPLLMEKYMTAADTIVDDVISGDGGRIPIRSREGKDLKQPENPKIDGAWLDFRHERTVEAKIWIPGTGEHELVIEYAIGGSDDSTENTARAEILVDGKKVGEQNLGWEFSKTLKFKKNLHVTKGEHVIGLRMNAEQPPGEGEERLGLNVRRVIFTGPLDGSMREYSTAMRRIFFKGIAPPDAEGRKKYAYEILKRQATRAFRRPVDEATLDRLVTITMFADAQPETSFEEAIRQAMTAILVSPKFLFRAEIQAEPDNPVKVIPIDEYALASRLSYFLWSSCPDEKLIELAGKNELRKNLRSEVDRMLSDDKSERFVKNFVGQWLQARDVETINIDARQILKIRDLSTALKMFSVRLRGEMKEETEMLFGHILRENRPATELLTADYAFVNEELAKWYGIPDVKGKEHQKVALKPEYNRNGGVLTQGNFLVVTSNPTRTSPVKRGLFVLENLLGTPPPPAPADVPELEASKSKKEKRTMREMMEVHREKSVCASCHKRMDPIGLALEKYNPVGQFRVEENGKPIDSSGELVTGERFDSVGKLAQVLATERKTDVQRCLAGKMLTYGIGRGVEYFDAPTIDQIVAKAEKKGGTLKEILIGVIESAPFQRRRGEGNALAKN